MLAVTHGAVASNFEFGSPWDLNFDRFADKLVRDHSSYFPNVTVAHVALAEYRRFLHMHQKVPYHHLAASKLVDLVWHEHIIDTQTYMKDSQLLFGHYLHHYPCYGEGRPFRHESELVDAYSKTYGEFPPFQVWEIPEPSVTYPGCPSPSPPTPPVPCPMPPPRNRLRLKEQSVLCLDFGEGLDVPATLQKCNGTNQLFDDVSYKISCGGDMLDNVIGRCLELPDGDTTSGNPVMLACCHYDHPNQNFAIVDGRVVYYGDGDRTTAAKCIEAGSMKEQNTLVIADCDGGDSQSWESVMEPWQQMQRTSCIGGSLTSCVDLCPREGDQVFRACLEACIGECKVSGDEVV